jgi:hypothetical protein
LFFMNLSTGHLALLASAAFAASLRLSADPVPGATAVAVVAELGEPAGRLAIGDRVELRYPRGSVILEKGVVTSSTLISPAEWEKRERERIGGEKAKVESAAREAAGIAERRNKANAALALLVADPRWKELTGEGRIETLARFAKVFPDADTSAVTKELARKREVELAEKRRITDLENRVAEAESRVGEAEVRARKAENRAEIANATARRAEASAEQARQNDAFYGLRTYNVIGGGKINGAYPDNYYPTTGASVTVSNGVIVVSPGYVPQGVTPRPVVITRPVPASQPVKKN